MRNRTTLLGIGDVAVLMQYLYMDGSHSVEVKNIIGVPLAIRMDEQGYVKIKNLNFPNVREINEELPLESWLAIVRQLKELPLKELAGHGTGPGIQNRWDEIEAIVKTSLSLNR